MRTKDLGIVGFVFSLSLALGIRASNADEEHSYLGVVTSATAGSLSITDEKGENRTFSIDEKVVITINGKPGKLEDLQKGLRIRVITDKGGKALTVSTLDAHK